MEEEQQPLNKQEEQSTLPPIKDSNKLPPIVNKNSPAKEVSLKGGNNSLAPPKRNKQRRKTASYGSLVDLNFDKSSQLSMTKQDMMDVVQLTQEREVCEELDFLISKGRDRYLFEGFRVNPVSGINESEVEERGLQYGFNKFKARPPKTFCTLIKEALDDLTMIILIVCAIISIIINLIVEEHKLEAPIEGGAILLAVAACTLVAAGNDYQKEKQFMELQKVAEDKKKITIIREGAEKQIHNSEVVCGDIVKVEEGMNIPCDGILIKAVEVSTDESAMTGETDAIRKATITQCEAQKTDSNRIDYEDSLRGHKVPSPCLLSGTKIISGEGFFMCIVVGKDSCSGKIRSKLVEDTGEDDNTPLQDKLEIIATDISIFGLIGASLTVFSLITLFIVNSVVQGDFEPKKLTNLIDYFITGIAIIVMAVPEGLPLAVTLSLAFSVKKMLKDKNLVRKLYACETMGGANCICSDKTGTLTMNEMNLCSLWNRTERNFNFDEKHDLKDDLFNCKSDNVAMMVKMAFACNTSAQLHTIAMDEEGVKKDIGPSGNKTEIALLQFVQKCDVDPEDLKDEHCPEEGVRYPFTSKRKRMTTQVNYNGKEYLLLKGASEYVTGSCDKIHYWDDDSVVALGQDVKDEINDSIHKMAKKTLRTLCMGYKELNTASINQNPNPLGVYDIETSGFTFLCITGIRDVLRPSVKGSVKQCQIAGIKVRMVTGDNKVTAEAIAKECGIIQNGDSDDYDVDKQVWIGKDFWNAIGGVVKVEKKDKNGNTVLDDDKEPVMYDVIKDRKKFDEIYEKIDVIARCRPEDKYAMVLGLIANKNVVAVTGDGTNDAPALKRADVGFAMGNAGTEVAREAADIILLDDNFTSIVKAVLWGRNIYDSVRKFLQFQLTINVVAVVVVFVAALITTEAVLTAVQMLWVNMIMDTFAALALATEPPHQKLLLRAPHNREDYIVTMRMLKHIIVHAIFQAVILLVFTFSAPDFISEHLKDADPEVQQRLIDGGGWNDVWNYANNGHAKNQYATQADMENNMNIVQNSKGNIRIGTAFKKWGTTYEYYPMSKVYGPSRHLTLIFNLFVFLQIFNFVNARKIEDELNVFEGLSKSFWFMGIILLIIVLQILIVHIGNEPLNCSPHGLSLSHWLWCICIGAMGLVISFFTKLATLGFNKSNAHGKSKVQVVPEKNLNIQEQEEVL